MSLSLSPMWPCGHNIACISAVNTDIIDWYEILCPFLNPNSGVLTAFPFLDPLIHLYISVNMLTDWRALINIYNTNFPISNFSICHHLLWLYFVLREAFSCPSLSWKCFIQHHSCCFLKTTNQNLACFLFFLLYLNTCCILFVCWFDLFLVVRSLLN